MKYAVRTFAFGFVWLAFAAATSFAQQAVDTSRPRPIGWKDVASWRSIPFSGVSLSPDGQWVAYAVLPVDGDGELMVRKVQDTAVKKYPVGGSAFVSMSFSDDGRWLAFREAPKAAESKAAARGGGGRSLYDKMHLLELATGKKTETERVSRFAFNGRAATHIAVLLAAERGPGAPAPNAGRGQNLILRELATGKSLTLGNVAEFAFNKSGEWLAYTTDITGQTGNGAYLYHMPTGRTIVVDSDKAGYRSLNWTEEGNGLALLKMEKNEQYKQEYGSVIGVRDFGSVKPTIVMYDPRKDSASFTQGYAISPNRIPVWTDDLTRLLFGIHALEPVKKPGQPADTTDKKSVADKAVSDSARLAALRSDTSIRTLAQLQQAIAKLDSGRGKPNAVVKGDTLKPDMTLWHWNDSRLQSRQQVLQNQDQNFFYWAMYDTRSKAYRRLNEDNIRSLSPLPRHHYALATDISAYELDQNLDGQNYQDIYLVDLQTGARRMLFEKFYLPSFTSYPRASPDGRKLVYGRDGHFYIYDISADRHVNITEALPTSFINTEDDHNVEKPLTNVVDWTTDSRALLVRDLWDIWMIPAEGREKAVNLTRNGRADGIRYQYRFVMDPELKGIDPKQPLYVRMYGERNKKSGIGVIQPGKNGLQPGVTPLLWEDANIGRLEKARLSDTYLFTRETFTQPTEYFVAGPRLQPATQVTRNTPDLSKYAWSGGVKLVDYVSAKGDTLQGALFLPAGYREGQRYPTIVYYYEKLSQTLHNWSNPGFGGTGWNPAVYTSNGYAIFVPDIVYKLDDPGMSAVWCVLPGVDAAIRTGVVDPDRMGLHGHSWGGYQTCFLITQTNRFKAAAAGAPLTNMVSMYDLIYWNSGGGNMSIFEASQGRFRGAPWENWESYHRNSPIYHVRQVQTPLLMLHNDKDGAVDFTQGVEFYNALRRLKKPVVMAQYKGENHGLSKLENRKDYSVRMMEFFDHFLKGQPAPDWWQRGVDLLKLGEHLESRVF